MTSEELIQKRQEIADIFEEAAIAERKLPNKEKRILDCKACWPSYLYDSDDKKDQEPQVFKTPPTAKQIDSLKKAESWLMIVGMGRDSKTIIRKAIIWSKANKFSYKDIGLMAGMPPSTVELWHKKALELIARKIIL